MARIAGFATMAAATAGLASAAGALAQANCSLRNPDRQIYEIFPAATAYRTITGVIDETRKARIEEVVGSELVATDLGQHTVHMVLRDTAPLGFVHARAEVGARGSVELVWALDLDLALRDFRVQRCRERNADAVESDSFRKSLVGRNLAELKSLFSDGNRDVNLSALGAPADAAPLARTVLLCALKTRVITELAFEEPVRGARLLGHLHRAFPATASATRIADPFGGPALEAALQAAGGRVAPLETATATALRSLDGAGATLGFVVCAPWTDHPARPECWFAVAADGAVLEARLVGEAPEALRSQFASLAGAMPASTPGEPEPAVGSPTRCARFVLGGLTVHRARGPGSGHP
jgi:hypothetical protein